MTIMMMIGSRSTSCRLGVNTKSSHLENDYFGTPSLLAFARGRPNQAVVFYIKFICL